MLIAIAIISILAAVGIPQYNAYKIRGYDAHTRQALTDIYKLCNAYWIDTNPSEPCDISTIKTPIYGFTQNPDVTSTLSSLSHDKFCASAKHKDSTNAYSIDRAAVISPGNCGSVESRVEEVSLSTPIYDDPTETTPEENLIAEMLAEEFAEQTADPPGETFETYSDKTAADQCNKMEQNKVLKGRSYQFMMIEADGTPTYMSECNRMKELVPSNELSKRAKGDCIYRGGVGRTCSEAAGELGQIPDSDRPYGSIHGDSQTVRAHYCRRQSMLQYMDDSLARCMDEERTRVVLLGDSNMMIEMGGVVKYDFETGTWTNMEGYKFRNGKRVE